MEDGPCDSTCTKTEPCSWHAAYLLEWLKAVQSSNIIIRQHSLKSQAAGLAHIFKSWSQVVFIQFWTAFTMAAMSDAADVFNMGPRTLRFVHNVV